jgi:mevalonyl-CoA ligase
MIVAPKHPLICDSFAGGENIYPLEIEERLLAHKEIDRAVVVGVKDAHYGEVVAAFLQSSSLAGPANQTPRPPISDEAVREWVRASLGWHKAPAHIFWLGQDGVPNIIPLTGSGKVRRFEMAKMAEQILISAGIKARL